MHFIDKKPNYELTYSDVFIIPGNETEVLSRNDVDTSIPCELNMFSPVMVANMGAVAGANMAEVTARRGAMTVLTQNQPVKTLVKDIKHVKEASPLYETPIFIKENQKHSSDIKALTRQSPNRVAIIIDEEKRCKGFVFLDDHKKGIILDDFLTLKEMFNELIKNKSDFGAVVDADKRVVGCVTPKGIVRSEFHRPALDKEGRLMVGVAVGINEDVTKRVKAFVKAGADVILLDTANGHQKKLVDAVRVARAAAPDVFLIAGTVVSADGTRSLIRAGANMVKVGIGAGAMCITRMQTGVGRPQFSAVLSCSEAAKEEGGTVLADGGIKHPRDVAIAMAAGAACTMIGSWFAPTYESNGEVLEDEDGTLYVEHYGMASVQAVLDRSASDDEYFKIKKSFFEEGASHVKMMMRSGSESAEDILDQIMAGLRSTCSYAGVNRLADLHDEVEIGVQSPAAFAESSAVKGHW